MTIEQQTDRTLAAHFPSSFEALDALVETTSSFMAHVTDDEEFNYQVVLIASELATNAIEHGNANDASKTVTFRVVDEGAKVAITVQDEGTGFDPDAIASPLAQDNLLLDGGRGLFLIEAMADGMRYEDDGRRVIAYLDKPA
ncbi:MAG: ATP-binding protein [Bacteroidota bacterium]